jgi:ribosomal peptide maturation radical SAM protein 1
MPVDKDVFANFSELVLNGDVLLIVPPFSVIHYPSLAVHSLQACAKAAGVRVSVFYGSLNFAAVIGVKSYRALSDQMFMYELTRERVFAASAYENVPPLGHNADTILSAYTLPDTPQNGHHLSPDDYHKIQFTADDYRQVEVQARDWVAEVARAVTARPFKVVGCTTMFEQTAASLALLNHVKQLRPDIVTIMGGANCDGDMAEGIASLSQNVDYIFSGESEATFVDFLQNVLVGERPFPRIIRGQPMQDLNVLPVPDFGQYYEQLNHYLPEFASSVDTVELVYETSRGCWWGQKHHCTFCGLNEAFMAFREKSAEKVIADLEHLLARHPNQLVFMTDNIMPYSFFRTLVPRLIDLAAEMPSLRIFYEQKANLSLKQMVTLRQAGVTFIQAGIEALSTSLLKRMNKGVTASQNIALLRYGRSVGVDLLWNLLWAFPGDQYHEYEETLQILPLLRHLQPPQVFARLSIDRFCPYFQHPDLFGVTNIRPWPAHQMVLPPAFDGSRVAFHFTADYTCDAYQHPEIIGRLAEEVANWRKAWETKTITLFFGTFKLKDQPVLQVVQRDDRSFLLEDTRGLPETKKTCELTPAQVSAALVPRRYQPSPELEWALAHKIAVILDNNQYVPLATSQPEILMAFEAGLAKTNNKKQAD